MDAIEYAIKEKVPASGCKQLLLLAFCLLFTLQLRAQSNDRPVWISIHVGHQEYRGDLGNEFLDYELGTNWVLGYQGSIYLNPSVDLGLALNIGELDIQNGFNQANPALSETAFSKTYVNTYLFGRYKFANGKILSEKSFIQPYINAGIGLTAFGGGDESIKNGLTFMIPATLGLAIPVSETVKFYVQSTYNRTFADGFDGSNQFDNRSHDDYIVYGAGVKVALSASKRESGEGLSEPDFDAPALIPPATAERANENKKNLAEEESGKNSDTDSDGLSDEMKEPGEASDADSEDLSKVEETVDIPDSDDDGFNDEIDSCPQVAGVDYLEGCPDADGDEVGDAEDGCPKMAGDATLQGCPDDDSDGIINSIDECPAVAGRKELGGCPDKDRDSDKIIDAEDECPDEAGLPRLNGCSPRDSDKDGMSDDLDACPDKSGAATANGCPEEKKSETAVKDEQPTVKESMQVVPAALQKRVDVIYSNLQYKPGKAIITDSSKDGLNDLVQILNEHPKLQLIIEGYTDNAGEASYNLLLSEDRAEAVKQYMVGKGIDEIRLRAEGYGEILPVAPNDTEQGRAKNRRVELRITYHWVL